MKVGEFVKRLAATHGVEIVFKASYDKANRTSGSSFRGPGSEEGLRILAKVKHECGIRVLTDIHEPSQAAAAAQAVDILQIPAFLCRQTDLLAAAGATGRIVNVKKGQFMAPLDMKYAIDKVGGPVWLTERGTFFGYNRLVVDFAGVVAMRTLGVPVIFDATHSVQSPGGGIGRSSGNRELAVPLARAAAAVGVDGLFFEIHPEPDKALCDADNCISLDTFERLLPCLIELHHLGGAEI
jgi:2-dehydro-3-deoxyphosphooctonate aldolase (KDO 8-P synthase)